MDKEKEAAIAIKDILRDGAVIAVTRWAFSKIDDYQEPTRTGTRKGDPIGLSRKKYCTALLMPLHPTLKLKEIAKIVRTPEGVIRVWRTEKAFKEAVQSAYRSFGSFFLEIIEQKLTIKLPNDYKKSDLSALLPNLSISLEDVSTSPIFIVRFLPFFNNEVIMHVLKLLEKNELSKSSFGGLKFFVTKALFAHDKTSLRNWERRPEVLQHNKNLIGISLRGLTDPDSRKLLSPEQVQEGTNMLEEFIFMRLDILGG